MTDIPELSDEDIEQLCEDCCCPLCGYDGLWPQREPEEVKRLWRNFIHGMSMGDKTAKPKHKSDCAVYNAPAFEPGPCDCGALAEEVT